MTHAWIDASAGIAGDMLLGALLDAGASLAAVQDAVAAVVGDAVALSVAPVTRAGMRATKAEVDLLDDNPPHRTWPAVATMLAAADLPGPVRADAQRVFRRLAEAEARVHGMALEEVHFHEVGALDSIADVVGVCAALHDLGVSSIGVGEVALGAGEVRSAHGTMPVPVPAVVELALGWRVRSGGSGELTTPTGMALLVALAGAQQELPGLVVRARGIGAGTRDLAGRANVTRVVLGDLTDRASSPPAPALILAANVDDLDPRLWPGVLEDLLGAGADDVWLVPILMKKGRPAHTLHVLCEPGRADALRDRMLATTSTIGVRSTAAAKYALARAWTEVDVESGPVAVKVAHADGTIAQVTPEFEAVASRAATLGRAQHDVLTAAVAAAAAAGLTVGAPLPDRLAP